MALRFFGRTPDDKVDAVLEPIFILMYYGGFTYSEAYEIPVEYRNWFIERIVKEINRSHENGSGESRGAHKNTPEVREMLGKTKKYGASRTHRF